MKKLDEKLAAAKAKIAAKTAKAKEKTAAKCGRARPTTPAMVALALIVFGVAGGCQNPAQRAINTYVTLNLDNGSTVTFGAGDVGSAAQSNETGGNDAGQVASPTNDIKPDINVTVPVNKANAGTSAAGGALETVAGAAGDWLANKIKGSDDATTTTATNATECSGGSCTDCTAGSCEDK